jgi:hypothetical protein
MEVETAYGNTDIGSMYLQKEIGTGVNLIKFNTKHHPRYQNSMHCHRGHKGPAVFSVGVGGTGLALATLARRRSPGRRRRPSRSWQKKEGAVAVAVAQALVKCDCRDLAPKTKTPKNQERKHHLE